MRTSFHHQPEAQHPNFQLSTSWQADYPIFWVDGIHVQARLEDEAQCLLVIIGATPEGKKELVGLIDGVRESSQSWKGLLLDLKRRGLSMGPELAVADGALGFWQALEEVWPNTRGQRCWVHKTANVLQAAEEPAIEGQAGAAGGARPTSSKVRFATVRHRTVRSKGCLSNKTALAMIFKARRSRREKLASPQWPQPVAQIIIGVKFADGIEVVRPQAQPAAA